MPRENQGEVLKIEDHGHVILTWNIGGVGKALKLGILKKIILKHQVEMV